MTDKPFLILAKTARPLAQSARRSHCSVKMVDCFADEDTQLCGPARAIAWEEEEIAQALRQYNPDAVRGLVYGAGLEAWPHLLADWRGKLLGNSAHTLQTLKDPERVSMMLTQLGVPHPKISRTPPSSGTWLAKQPGGCGGKHVHIISQDFDARIEYAEEYVSGTTYSATFLADGEEIICLGFNEIWQENFDFCGGMGPMPIADAWADEVVVALQKMTRAFSLVGLNGVDFIVSSSGEWFVVDINPRPTAALNFYDEGFSGGLFVAHVASCEGSLPKLPTYDGVLRGFRVVNSAANFIPQQWPSFCRDLPTQPVAVGEILCTVHGVEDNPDLLRTLLRNRELEIQQYQRTCQKAAQKF